MDDHILKIDYTEDWGAVHGSILVDLREIAGAAGVRKTAEYFDNIACRMVREPYTDMPMTQARKICRLIARLARPEDRDRVTAYFMRNAKLSKVWAEALAKEAV